MMFTKISNFRGFTLLEVLIVVTITSVIGFLVTQLLIQNNSVYFREDAKVSQGLSLNTASSQLQSDIKQASAVAVSYPTSSPTYISSLDTLVLQLISIDGSGNVIEDTFDHIVYFKDPAKSNILRKQVFPDALSSRKASNQVLATSLSKINFTYLDQNNSPISPASAIKINFIINVSNKAGVSNHESSSSGQVNLRNN